MNTIITRRVIGIVVVLALLLAGISSGWKAVLAGEGGPRGDSAIPTPTLAVPAPANPGWVDNLEQIDCSTVKSLQLEQQANLRAAAIRIHCGLEQPGDRTALGGAGGPAAPTAGGTDVQVNNALADTYPHVLQTDTRTA